MMKLNRICKIIANMSEARFDKIQNAEDDYWNLDARISRNGKRRMIYNLAAEGLTLDDWFTWCGIM